MRVISIVGARPEFIQVAVLSPVLRARHEEVLVHTGQHYDAAMSAGFFDQLKIPEPEVNLAVGSLSTAAQVAEMLRRLEPVLAGCEPDMVVVRGDTNSTLAGALAAKMLGLPLAHVEAGMRSYDASTPEERNRVVTDHIADVFFVTDASAAQRLAREGIGVHVYVCGDVMYDLYLRASARADGAFPHQLRDVANVPYDLLTLHRGENVDDADRLRAVLGAFEGAPRPIVFPVHPRTRERIARAQIVLPQSIRAVEPLGYLQMLALERRARLILTDSGGVAREAYFAGVPCITLRDRTEWTNTVEAGWNRLAGADSSAIARWLRAPPPTPAQRPPLFGDGHAAECIVSALESAAVQELIARSRQTRTRFSHVSNR